MLAGASLTILSSIYPPLDPESAGEGRYAFFLDPRFDASTKVPDYTVNEPMLLFQWLIITAVVALPIAIAQIGRAKCRERECPSGLISVVGVSLKTQHKAVSV